MGKVALCADLMGVAVVSVLALCVVSVVAGVYVMVIIVDVMMCLGFEGIYGGCCYYCWVGFFFLYLEVGQKSLLVHLQLSIRIW